MPDVKRQFDSLTEREYDSYLTRERGLAASTRVRHLETVRRFLGQCSGLHSANLGVIGAEQISAFMISEASRVCTHTLQVTATVLRSFLRFLLRQGLIATDLASSVPTARSWALAALPRYLPPEQVERVLECCDRTTSIGRRDYAILLFLARLGLRATEVVALTLDDIDWRAGDLLVRGKGYIHDRLPLPHDIGAALTAYLQQDRRSDTRRLFVPIKGPQTMFADGESINVILKRALRRAGVQAPAKGIGSHLLRHSLATSMIRHGASLAEIGAVLRHRSVNTTRIYAKVDIEGLRSIARPWPLEVQS
jgi:site-specific recombinase XerD